MPLKVPPEGVRGVTGFGGIPQVRGLETVQRPCSLELGGLERVRNESSSLGSSKCREELVFRIFLSIGV